MSQPTYPPISKFQFSSPSASTTASLQLPVHNPATGALITTLHAGDASTARAAIAASAAAVPSWRSKTQQERGQILLSCSAALEAHADELATLLCLENGKPKADARGFDIAFLINVFKFFGSLVDKMPTQFHDRGSVYVSVVREPHGVCAGILPWNWPPIHTGGKTAPCLAMGNTMILKPGEQAPLTTLRIVEILQTVLPKDVLLAVPGQGTEVPQALLESSEVKMVSFTGSTAGGTASAVTAAKTLKPMALELGGKNAFVVFKDADLERAARDLVEAAFFNKGEACTAGSRAIIQDEIYDEFTAKVGSAVKRLRVGDGMDPETHVGPLITQKQKERVLEYIKIGKEEGATLAAEGELPREERLKNGFFVKPTLFTEVTRDMTIAQDEIFGPVLVALRFKDEDEAVSICNESKYGLVSAVYTKDMEKGFRAARRIEAGMLYFNNYWRNILGLPFGGVKDSGHGREHAIETLDEWSVKKFIQFPSGKEAVPSWRGSEAVLGAKSNL